MDEYDRQMAEVAADAMRLALDRAEQALEQIRRRRIEREFRATLVELKETS